AALPCYFHAVMEVTPKLSRFLLANAHISRQGAHVSPENWILPTFETSCAVGAGKLTEGLTNLYSRMELDASLPEKNSSESEGEVRNIVNKCLHVSRGARPCRLD